MQITWERITIVLQLSHTNHFLQNLPKALSTLCGILTRDAEGGPSRIGVELFEELYRYLASVDRDISVRQVDDAMKFLREES